MAQDKEYEQAKDAFWRLVGRFFREVEKHVSSVVAFLIAVFLHLLKTFLQAGSPPVVAAFVDFATYTLFVLSIAPVLKKMYIELRKS